MRVLGKVLKRLIQLFLWLIVIVFVASVFGEWIVQIGWYLAFGWIHFMVKNLASVELNLPLLAAGIVCTAALGIGTHYFCRWLYRETGPSTGRAWRWQWTASGLAVVLLLFVAGIGTIGVVHQAAWLFNTDDRLLEDSWNRRARVSTALIIGSDAKTAVAEHYDKTGRLPQSGDEAGYSRNAGLAGTPVSAIEIREKGVVVVTLSRDRDWPDGSEITLTPMPIADAGAKSLRWKCRSTLPLEVLPASCRE